MMTWTPIAIAIGAVLGALSRYYITLYWLRRKGDRFPFGTLFVNLTGVFLMGLTTFLHDSWPFSSVVSQGWTVGFLGSYTTFSSYILDTVNLSRNGHPQLALGYWIGSAVLGLLCIQAGLLLARAIAVA